MKKWILEVSSRFAKVDRNGRSAVTAFFASLGICFGVMTLITVISVMNGFQAYSINPIMEVSGYHLRISKVPQHLRQNFYDWSKKNPLVRCTVPFYEAEALLSDSQNRTFPALVRGVTQDILELDEGFSKELHIVSGSFNLEEENSMVIGYALADSLKLTLGSKVNIMALSGSKDVALISGSRIFTVTGIFSCSFPDIENICFISSSDAALYFGKESEPVFGIKLKKYEQDSVFAFQVKEKFPEITCESWRQFNRSFFGALRIEKNILFILVCIIFIVVGINIYNGMRRLVFERQQEIAVFSALGGSKKEIQSIFVMQGFRSGLKGTFFGLIFGLLLSVNIRSIFMFLGTVTGNYMFTNYAQIPAVIVFKEVLFICLFALASPVVASYKASKSILLSSISEVLRNE